MGGGPLARRRFAETQASAKIAGIEYDEAGSRVLVARLTYGTRVYQITCVGIEFDASVFSQRDDI